MKREIFVPYKDRYRLQRMEHLAGTDAAINALLHEVDHPTLQVKL